MLVDLRAQVEQVDGTRVVDARARMPELWTDKNQVHMTKLYCMRGYSGSGKSTRAAEIVKETGAVIVNRDYLRKMMLGAWWTGDAADEELITIAEEELVTKFIKAGSDVVIDATHLNPRYLRKWARTATRWGAEFEVVDVRTNKAMCRMNDIMRKQRGEREVGKEVIDRQAKQWPMEKWPTITAEPFVVEPYVAPEVKPDAIIVDIDGTLAHIPEGGRSPYDYTRVMDDTIDYSVRDIVNRWRGDYVIVVSGRDDTCREATRAWLLKNHVRYDALFMRDTKGDVDSRGGKLPDYIVKYRLFNEYIRHNYDIEYVIDDRKQVIEMWRKLGLKVLDVMGNEF